jgi:hypothetical protein
MFHWVLQGDTLDYLGIPGLHIAGAQGVVVIAFCQVILMVSHSSMVLTEHSFTLHEALLL